MRTPLFLILVALASATHAKLAHTSLDEFRKAAPCGLIVDVIDVVDSQIQFPATSRRVDRIGRLAIARVAQVIGQCSSAYLDSKGEVEFLFSTEIHSSHPEAGEQAVVFLQKRDAYFQEAVYGRSYWRLKSIDGVVNIEVTWRNQFLISPLDLAGARAYVPLDVIKRRWAHSAHSTDP